MKEEALDMVLYELEQADSIGADEGTERVITLNMGGYSSLICC